MEFEKVRKYLEKEPADNEPTKIHELPLQFFERFIVHGIRVDLLEPGRLLCSYRVPPRLLNTANTLHGGAIASLVDMVGSAVIYSVGAPSTGVSVEINVSYLEGALPNVLPEILERDKAIDSEVNREEIEIEAKNLRVGKAIAVVSVELRKKETGKIIAQGRHTKFLAVPSKL